jgi:hypothetical protein
MTKATKWVIDPDVLAAAREIYGRRDGQKFGGNRRWRQLVLEFPDLAEAVRPSPKDKADRSQAEVDAWRSARDEAERDHRAFEKWARSQTAARRPYYYRGRNSVLQDAQSNAPDWIKPYGSWHHTDRGRWTQGKGAGPDQMTWGDSHVEHKVRGQDLRTLHAETDGGYTIEGDGTRENQLEVCRLCGAPLQFERNDEGDVIRGRGEQQEYCPAPARCKRDVYNARRRAKRRDPQPKTFQLVGGIYVAGVGKLDIPVSKWNTLSRDRRAGIEDRLRGGEPPSGSGSHLRLPYLHRNARSLSISSAEMLSVLREVAPSGWTTSGGHDSIARRWGEWQSYWHTAGITEPIYESRVLTVKSHTLPKDWDRVAQWWRYVAREADCGRLKQEAEKVWCISH